MSSTRSVRTPLRFWITTCVRPWSARPNPVVFDARRQPPAVRAGLNVQSRLTPVQRRASARAISGLMLTLVPGISGLAAQIESMFAKSLFRGCVPFSAY